MKGHISIDRERCKGCGLCVHFCPRQVIAVSKDLNQKGYYPAEPVEAGEDAKGCNACTICGIVCPDVAIEVYRD